MSTFLETKGIETRTFFYPLNKQPCFAYLKKTQDLSDTNFKNSIDAYNRGLCFPAYPTLTEEQVGYICNKIKEAFAQ